MKNIIEEIRKERGISRRELSRQTKVPYVTLNVIAKGGVSELKYFTAKKIADFAGLNAYGVMENYRQWREQLT